ncbi:hypothetical protein N7541_004416 [Penicillium brevicompactum]|uniref:CENP-V/GFA domain-containing protein n=1 Tax=Penicillium brevicompactum TaxID=5074 RepID=A0A9W9RBR6_PENBR|nr:hypothetical protein N7541_004416 [Penicillium brevicompactum]
MSYQGHCNCESIRITLPQQPANTVICHCIPNTVIAANGLVAVVRFPIQTRLTFLLILLPAFSLNYFVGEEDMTVEDTRSTLKIYEDKKSTSGNIVKRHFCSDCGSPVFTKTPKAPGKAFLKAALFDTISSPSTEVFANKQLEWVDLGATEKHA